MEPEPMNRAVFLDRDGVLIEDVHLLAETSRIRIMPGAAQALSQLHRRGFLLIVITNQPIVARGLITEAQVQKLHMHLNQLLQETGAPVIDAYYFCPHHPNATLPEYRRKCECRKPGPGLLLQAARDHQIDLPESFLIGDRITDIAAGAAAGCRTILLTTGRHTDPPIETAVPLDPAVIPDRVLNGILPASDWILSNA